MKTYPPTDRPACEVFAGGQWWPGYIHAEDEPNGRAMRYVEAHVVEWLTVPRVGVVPAPARYLRWVDASRVRDRANDETAPAP